MHKKMHVAVTISKKILFVSKYIFLALVMHSLLFLLSIHSLLQGFKTKFD